MSHTDDFINYVRYGTVLKAYDELEKEITKQTLDKMMERIKICTPTYEIGEIDWAEFNKIRDRKWAWLELLSIYRDINEIGFRL